MRQIIDVTQTSLKLLIYLLLSRSNKQIDLMIEREIFLKRSERRRRKGHKGLNDRGRDREG